MAQQHISIAKRLQKLGKLDEAFDNYQIALSGLLELYKADQDLKRKTALGALIEVILLTFRIRRAKLSPIIEKEFLVTFRNEINS